MTKERRPYNTQRSIQMSQENINNQIDAYINVSLETGLMRGEDLTPQYREKLKKDVIRLLGSIGYFHMRDSYGVQLKRQQVAQKKLRLSREGE